MLLFWSFLAFNDMLTPFFLIIILSWVAPHCGDLWDEPWYAQKVFTAWGTYMTLVSFTVCTSCSFVFTDTFILHLIVWPFPTVTLISNFLHLSCIFTCVWYAMTRRCLLTILWYLLHCSLLVLLHRMWFPWIGYQRHRISLFISLPRNQHLCDLFFHSFCIPLWKAAFLKYYLRLCYRFYYYFPNSLKLGVHNCLTFKTRPWRTWYSCLYIYFLRRSKIEPSLMIILFPVFSLCSALSSRINVYLSSSN